MNWQLELAKLEFGFYNHEDIPNIACAALELGYDTPSLQILAGLSLGMASHSDVEKYWNKTLNELKIIRPAKEELAWILIRHIIDKIINKEIKPHDGLHLLVWQVYNQMNWSTRNTKYVGDAIGIHTLYGLCIAYDDLANSNHRWDSTKTNYELLEEIENDIYKAIIDYKMQKFGD